MQKDIQNQSIQTSVLFDDSAPCINTSSNDKNVVHKSSATSLIHTIKTSLKSAKNQHSALIIFGKGMKKLLRALRVSEECGKKNMPFRAEIREFQKIRREIKFPQSHNNALSLM